MNKQSYNSVTAYVHSYILHTYVTIYTVCLYRYILHTYVTVQPLLTYVKVAFCGILHKLNFT